MLSGWNFLLPFNLKLTGQLLNQKFKINFCCQYFDIISRQKPFKLKSIRIAICACSWIGSMLVQHHPTCCSRTFQHVGPTPPNMLLHHHWTRWSNAVHYHTRCWSTIQHLSPTPHNIWVIPGVITSWSKTMRHMSNTIPHVMPYVAIPPSKMLVQHHPTFFFPHHLSCWSTTMQQVSLRLSNIFSVQTPCHKVQHHTTPYKVHHYTVPTPSPIQHSGLTPPNLWV